MSVNEHPAPFETTASPKRRPVGLAVVLSGILLFAWFVFDMPGWPRSFSSADIEAAKKSIRAEWSKQDGVTVDDVVLVKKSSTELTGFVKLRANTVLVTKECNATMDSGSGQYLWRCQ